MSDFRYMNDLSPLVKAWDMNTLSCPICGKVYKTSTGVIKHVTYSLENEFECASMAQLFGGTLTEELAQTLYADFIFLFDMGGRANLSSFRKSKSYSSCIKFVLFCMKHQVKDRSLFLTFVMNTAKGKFRHFNMVLALAMKDESIRDYRRYLRNNEEFIDSATFYTQNKEKIDSGDEEFIISSIRKGHIGVLFLFDNCGFAETLERFSLGSQMAFQELIS